RNPEEMRGQIRKSIESVDTTTQASAGEKLVLKGLLGTVDQFLGTLGPQMKELEKQGEGGGPSMQLARIDKVDVTAMSGGPNDVTKKLRSPWDISFPSAMLWGVIGCVAGFAVSLVKEQTEGTLLRLKVAPITRWD